MISSVRCIEHAPAGLPVPRSQCPVDDDSRVRESHFGQKRSGGVVGHGSVFKGRCRWRSPDGRRWVLTRVTGITVTAPRSGLYGTTRSPTGS